MSEAPILKDTTRSNGREALQKNIQAAMALAEAIRSTLGPKGLDKLLIDDEGRTLVTNDGVTVLETAKVEHPVAKMMINASSTQDRVAKDGTTSTVILAGEMLQNAWQLILQGIHPSTIARGYRKSEQFILESLPEIVFDSDDEIKHSVVNTTLAGKGHSSMQEIIAKLSLEAVQIVAESDSSVDISKIKLISQTGGKVEDSRVFRGLMLPKKRISSDMKREVYEGKILLVDGGLEKNNVSTDLKLNVTTVGIIESFRQEERKMLKQMVDRLVDNNISVLACRESIDDDIKNYLTEQGIQAFRRVSRNDLNMLAKTCNASIVNSIMGISAKNIGEFISSKNITIDGKDFWVVEGDGNAATIVAKASTVDVVGEVERCFDDSLGVSTQLIEDGKVVCGGGAAYVALAKRLRRFAETIPGREQLAIEAYADAIEVIVRVLAENAGIDPISALLDVVAEQTNANSDNIGLNLTNGKPGNMIELGVLEPQGIIKQAIIGATEVAISILRIDDVLWAKQEMEMPELPDEEL
ncbi:MAG: thermosome subunit alpha [Candidatus Thermoplasmatota archaeon]|nr:thermosome subunit alpha [Candidatus Thermoplasmatota archaeon]